MAKYEARGKVQRKFYITEALADTLRIEAAKRNESQSAIVERSLRKELGLMEAPVNIIEVGAPGENHAERVAESLATLPKKERKGVHA